MRLTFTTVLVSLILTSSALFADQIEVEYTFDRPSVSTVSIGDVSYHRITMRDGGNGGDVGEPALPASHARILIPAGMKVSGIEIDTDESVSLGRDFIVEPISRQIALSADPSSIVPPKPDSLIYSSEERFPGNRHEYVSTQRFRGFTILILKLQPVDYIPASGELLYYPRIVVRVETVKSESSSPLFRGSTADFSEVRDKVDNADIVSSYSALGNRGREDYQFLIITEVSLVNAFLPLKNYHDSTGIPTEIRTTYDIGGSTPDDLRDFIRDQYLDHGIQYALIGGDDNMFPAKDLFVEIYNGGSVEFNMPGDIYFGCLDGTYNSDGDTYWGEPNDGPNGGDVDLIAEVYVGRAPVDSVSDVNRFVNKTIQYMTSQDTYIEDVLMVGEYLGFGGVGDYGAYSLDEIVDGSSNHGYVTVGIPSDQYDIEKLYDLTWSGSWPSSEIVTRINNGINIINHYGHSSTGRSMRLWISDVLHLLNNEDPCFIYSQGCLAGHFDGMDCWAENITVRTEYGAFAAVMNARYGFGAIYSTDGASQRYDREFWDAVFSPSEGKPEIGRAHHDSKEDNLYRINEGCMRWCYYGLNLFGDPTVPIRGMRSIAFDFPDGIPEVVTPGLTTEFTVQVRGVGDGVPVSGSGLLHYSINGEDFETVVMEEVAGDEYTAILPAISCGDRMEFYLSAEELLAGQISDTDPDMPHTTVSGTNLVILFEDDFETDQGWSVTSGQWQRGIPTGDGGNVYSGPDPSSGCEGPNVYGYNLSGNYTDFLPERHLTSPAIDCTDKFGTRLRFWRWLGVEAPIFDHAYIRISTNGSDWTNVWENSAEVFDASWTEINLDISEIADDQPAVYLRWTMGTTDSKLTYCGWNIDDLRVLAWECGEYVCGDPDGNWAVDIDDVVFLINYIFAGGTAPDPLETGDADCSGAVDIDDAVYLINYIFAGGNDPCDTDGDGAPDC